MKVILHQILTKIILVMKALCQGKQILHFSVDFQNAIKFLLSSQIQCMYMQMHVILQHTQFIKMADTRKRSGMSYQQHGVEAFQDTKQHGVSVISSNTMSSVSLCKNDIPGSSLDRRNPLTNILSVLKCLALACPLFFMNLVYCTHVINCTHRSLASKFPINYAEYASQCSHNENGILYITVCSVDWTSQSGQ